MPQGVQAKLLRALQEKAVRPLGSVHTVPVDVRITSATHRNLEQGMLRVAFERTGTTV